MSITIGDYRLIDTIGEGSTSNVKLAQSKSAGIYYEIKRIKKSNLENPQINKQLNREIKVSSKLNHQSIVKMHGIIESKINIYMILDYVDGGDLCHQLKKKWEV